LKALDVNAQYEITDLMLSKVIRLTGRELMDKGLKIIIDNKPGAAVILSL